MTKYLVRRVTDLIVFLFCLVTLTSRMTSREEVWVGEVSRRSCFHAVSSSHLAQHINSDNVLTAL